MAEPVIRRLAEEPTIQLEKKERKKELLFAT
jgi:ribosomal protein S25